MLRREDIGVERVVEIYDAVIDLLAERGYQRAEAVGGLAAIIVVQVLGEAPDPDRLRTFITDLSEYVGAYFGAELNPADKGN